MEKINLSIDEKQKAARLEFACRYFDKKKLIRIEPNGYDLKKKEYSIPGGYCNADTFAEAIDIIERNDMFTLACFLQDRHIDEHLAAWEIPVHITTNEGKRLCIIAGELHEKLCKKYPTDTYFTEKMLNDTINEL